MEPYESKDIMINDKRILALIPARGGSKGVPGKNLKRLFGKPLIAWTIEEAKKSRYIDKIVVSTDYEAIANVAVKYGAAVPFKRPRKLASDNAKMIDVMSHCIRFFQNIGDTYDIIILLQPTSPLRSVYDIDKAVEFFIEKAAKAVVGVVECEYSPWLTNILPKDLNMNNFLKKNIINKNRQELKAYYRVNGVIYLSDIDFIINKRDWYGPKTFAYIMKRENSVDIDDLFDFMLAEFIMNKRHNL